MDAIPVPEWLLWLKFCIHQARGELVELFDFVKVVFVFWLVSHQAREWFKVIAGRKSCKE